MQNRNRLVERIQKILRKAKNNPNAAEAENAMLMAQRLQQKHAICDNELLESEEDVRISANHSKTRKQHSSWMILLANVIARNFRCHMYQNIGGRSRYENPEKQFVFYGANDDAEIAKDVFEFAIEVANLMWQQYRAINKTQINRRVHPGNARKEFYLGFVYGVQGRFTEQVEKYGLTLVKHELVEQQYELLSKGFTSSKYKPPAVGRLTNAFYQGYCDGKDFMSLSGGGLDAEKVI